MASRPSEKQKSESVLFSWLLLAIILSGTIWDGALQPLHADVEPGALTSTFPHTTFLPLLTREHWVYTPALRGVQLIGLDAPVIDQVPRVGAQWVRIPFLWVLVEPVNTTPDQYRWWDWLDAALAELSLRDVQVILTLGGNPEWAATYSGGPVDRADITELVEFMVAAVERYGAPPYNVKHWEFYNEPDNGNELFAERGWGYFGHQPQAYVDMLRAVYQPIKAVDPEAQIVMGGLAYDWFAPDGPFVREFLDDVLQNGGGDLLDVMNFHYYLAFRQNWEPYGIDIIGKANYLREKLRSYGVDKPLICTETGMWSSEEQGGNDELQSRYVVQVFARAAAARLDPTIWFTMVDEAGLGGWKYGLLRSDLSPKPSYYAYRTLARQLSFAEYSRKWSLAETKAKQIEAYEFLSWSGQTRIVVVWANDGFERLVPIETPWLIKVDKFGTQTLVYDADDGQTDGRVSVSIGPSPIYLRLSP